MKLAIHHRKRSFSEEWIKECDRRGIPYKLVNCFDSDIVAQVADCDALLWHFHHAIYKDVLAAKTILTALSLAGKKVFPDFNTNWHFDSKVAQKYFLEALGLPTPPSHVFYTKKDALKWIDETTFPKVFKLSGGSGSANVQLVRTKERARQLTNQAFSTGFSQFDAVGNLKERFRKFRLGKERINGVVKGVAKLVISPDFAKEMPNQKGYIYFQDFIPDATFDVRVVVIGDKAIALKRHVRENDFRASGSGFLEFDKELFDPELIRFSFEATKKLRSQSMSFDYIFDNGKPLILEMSYGFSYLNYFNCPGYWDSNMVWHETEVNLCAFMIDDIVKSIQNTTTQPA